jgi:hypothetical protein
MVPSSQQGMLIKLKKITGIQDLLIARIRKDSYWTIAMAAN